MPDEATPSRPVPEAVVEAALREAASRLDALALGVALGATCGLLVFGATLFLLLRGGDPIGPTLALLSQYFTGYRVTPGGSLVGLAYGAGVGFVLGWSMGALYNLTLALHLHVLRLKANLTRLTDYLDPDHVS